MSNDAGVAVLEVGGSHVTAAVVVPGSWRVESLRRTPLNSQTSAEEIVAQLAQVAGKLPLANGLALALPGPFDYRTGIAWYRGVEKFDALYGHDLGASLRALLGLERIVFVNDAEAFSVGEWTAGTLQGLARCAGITIGTGIGSAFLADGRVVRDGETVPPGGELYRTDLRGRPLEDWISSRAILRAYAERLGRGEAAGARAGDGTGVAGSDGAGAAGSESAVVAGGRLGEAAGKIGVKEIAEAARAGDPVAHAVLIDAFTCLAEALTPWLERFGATRVVLGGSISGAFDLVQQVFDFDVTVTTDTEHHGLIGAAALATD
ncbi:ROK family protein [Kribbella flavida DSM 17836]|uniref:ROK family protein n=1 Tax=Kribbella flavida (strain DSM 17836 / JCM 10339 / NBRC 14399) TaxID=479435 RepID=D2PQ57_KRIFD|nr:ROK family protein [Kribbella flavida]ADB34759.1 ROK family protein [Kribbella flavida DSM 17836]